jgi:hypothetical protein
MYTIHSEHCLEFQVFSEHFVPSGQFRECTADIILETSEVSLLCKDCTVQSTSGRSNVQIANCTESSLYPVDTVQIGKSTLCLSIVHIDIVMSSEHCTVVQSTI